jgi:hypothetical protein
LALSAALVRATQNRLRYLILNRSSGGEFPVFGTTLTIPNDGGATPDLRTDADTVGGPIKRIMNAGVTGIGLIAAGAMTQANARALLMEDRTSNIGNEAVPRACTTIVHRAGDAVFYTIDANVDAQGDPILEFACEPVAGDYYLDIRVQHSIWE